MLHPLATGPAAYVSARWQVPAELTTSSGPTLMRAVEYYAAAIESGTHPQPAKPTQPEKTKTANETANTDAKELARASTCTHERNPLIPSGLARI